MATGGGKRSLEEGEKLDTVFRKTMEKYYISSEGIQILAQQGFGCFEQIDMMEYEIAKEYVDGMPLKIADKVAFLSLIRRRNQSTESDLHQVTFHEDMAKPMTSRHSEIIRKSLYSLPRLLKIFDLLVKLVSMGTITQEDVDTPQHTKPAAYVIQILPSFRVRYFATCKRHCADRGSAQNVSSQTNSSQLVKSCK